MRSIQTLQDVHTIKHLGEHKYETTFLVRAWVSIEYLDARADERSAADNLYYLPALGAFTVRVYA